MSCSLRSIFSTSLLSVTLLSCLLCFAPAAANELPVIDVDAWTQSAELTLPANRTTLHVRAHAVEQSPNPLTYRWIKVAGPPSGRVQFSPNGDTSSDTTTATFSRNVTGTYTLRVIVSDGITESISNVEVRIKPRSGAELRDSKFRAEQRGGCFRPYSWESSASFLRT